MAKPFPNIVQELSFRIPSNSLAEYDISFIFDIHHLRLLSNWWSIDRLDIPNIDSLLNISVVEVRGWSMVWSASII